MTGYAHYFDDLAPWTDEPAIGTAYVRYVKLDGNQNRRIEVQGEPTAGSRRAPRRTVAA